MHRISIAAALVLAAQGGAGLDVRYVANAGVMVTIDGRKFLIDAPIRDGITPYATSSAEERRRLEAAAPPYDGVSAILVTHWHEDHFSPEAIAEHLRHSQATLISSQEVVARVRRAAPDLAASRFAAVTPAMGTSTAVDRVPGVKVHVLRARHNPTRRWPEEHVAFVIAGSQAILHTGDAELTPANFAMLASLPKIDLAIVPYWHLLNDTTRTQTIDGFIKPGRILGMHLPPGDAREAQQGLDDKKVRATLLVTPATAVPPARLSGPCGSG